MPTPRPPPAATLLLQLLAELEGYEQALERLMQAWHRTREVVLFGEAGKAMDRLRTLSAALPPLSVHWLMVLISHTELMHNLWRASRGERLDVAGDLRDHLAAVREMAAAGRRLLARGGAVLH